MRDPIPMLRSWGGTLLAAAGGSGLTPTGKLTEIDQESL